MARASTFELYDRLAFNGRLAATLRGWRDEGLTQFDMTLRLREFGVITTQSTVSRWLRRIEGEAA